MKKQWFVFYTKSRQERKVNEFLYKAGYEVFLPMHKVVRQWSDRKKKIEVPLFNSYIFVREEEHNISSILKFPGIAWNIRLNGKPAVLREEDAEMIRRLVQTGFTLETSRVESDFKSGDRAEIMEGPLAGLVGIISRQPNNENFTIVIEGIGQVIRVKIPSFLLRKV
jgi:transcriptional antiterminator NusG